MNPVIIKINFLSLIMTYLHNLISFIIHSFLSIILAAMLRILNLTELKEGHRYSDFFIKF